MSGGNKHYIDMQNVCIKFLVGKYNRNRLPFQQYTKTKSTIFTNTLTDRKPTDSLLRRSRKMLDCFATRDNNNKLSTTVYRKPTYTDRLLGQPSDNPTSHKVTTIQTLTRRAQLICDSPDSFADETQYLDNVFNKNNYNKDFVRRDTYKNTEPNVTNSHATLVTTATIPLSKALLKLSHGFYSTTTSV